MRGKVDDLSYARCFMELYLKSANKDLVREAEYEERWPSCVEDSLEELERVIKEGVHGSR